MLDTAETVAAKHQISTGAQHDVVMRRLEQYADAVTDQHAFQNRFMNLPQEVPTPDFRKSDAPLMGDEGIFQSTAEGLAKLKPVKVGGTVTYGGQTHPADGNAGILVVNTERAADYSADGKIRIQILGFGQSRVALGHMPEATVPAAQQAMQLANVGVSDLASVKTHNPFAVNDIVLSKAIGFPLDQMNNFGCSLVWGHPHAATAVRSIIELIEELVLRGGGFGLFTGCAAGDSGMAVVLKVSSR